MTRRVWMKGILVAVGGVIGLSKTEKGKLPDAASISRNQGYRIPERLFSDTIVTRRDAIGFYNIHRKEMEICGIGPHTGSKYGASYIQVQTTYKPIYPLFKFSDVFNTQRDREITIGLCVRNAGYLM